MAPVDKKQFSERLIAAMRARGHFSQRQAKSGVDAQWLAKKGRVSRHAAEKWLDGTSIPQTDTCKLVAKELNISYLWLMYGLGTMEPGILDDLLEELSPMVEAMETTEELERFRNEIIDYARFIAPRIAEHRSQAGKAE